MESPFVCDTFYRIWNSSSEDVLRYAAQEVHCFIRKIGVSQCRWSTNRGISLDEDMYEEQCCSTRGGYRETDKTCIG